MTEKKHNHLKKENIKILVLIYPLFRKFKGC